MLGDHLALPFSFRRMPPALAGDAFSLGWRCRPTEAIRPVEAQRAISKSPSTNRSPETDKLSASHMISLPFPPQLRSTSTSPSFRQLIYGISVWLYLHISSSRDSMSMATLLRHACSSSLQPCERSYYFHRRLPRNLAHLDLSHNRLHGSHT